jgi:hypothetical protein
VLSDIQLYYINIGTTAVLVVSTSAVRAYRLFNYTIYSSIERNIEISRYIAGLSKDK